MQQITQIDRLEYGRWRITWTDAGEDHHVWLDGRRLAITQDHSIEITTGDPDEPPAIEVISQTEVGAGEQPQQQRHPSRVTLQWYWTGQAEGTFAVEQWDGSAWAARATLTAQGLGYYRWQSGPQASDSTTRWRIRYVGPWGNEVIVVERQIHVARNPDPPAVSLSVSGGTLTVSDP